MVNKPLNGGISDCLGKNDTLALLNVDSLKCNNLYILYTLVHKLNIVSLFPLTYLERTFCKLWDKACASIPGGPEPASGRELDGRSTLQTTQQTSIIVTPDTVVRQQRRTKPTKVAL